MKVNQSSTHINYEIDDGTGVIQVRIWIESDDSSNHISRQLNTVEYDIILLFQQLFRIFIPFVALTNM